MKKRIVVAILLLFTICVSVYAFVGCSIQRHQTLELFGIRQIADGSLVLEIKDIENVVGQTVQVSFDNGITWEDAKITRDYSTIKDECSNYYCVAKVSEDKYGKKCNIAVRLATDKNKLESETSNIIEYYVKKPSEFDIKERFINGLDSVKYADQYVFLCEDDKIILMKLNKGGLILPVEEIDQLEFEYKTYKKSDIPDYVIEYSKDFLEEKALSGDNNFDEDDLEWVSYIHYVADSMSNYRDDKQYKDYDYQKGISKDEYGEWVPMNNDGDDEEFVQIVVRLKENDTTTYSNYAIINVTR